MPHLRDLAVTNCDKSVSLDITELPELELLEISQLANLNRIRIISCPKLQLCTLRENRLLRIVDVRGTLQDLTTLDLCGCTSLGDEALINLITMCPRLQTLVIKACCRITDVAMPQLCERLPDLKQLMFRDNLLVHPTMHFVSDKLEYVDLSYAVQLESVDIVSQSITGLNLMYTNVTSSIFPILSRQCPNIMGLWLGHCPFLNSAIAAPPPSAATQAGDRYI